MDTAREGLRMRAEILRAYLAVLDEPEKLRRVCAGVSGDAADARAAVAAAFAVGDVAAEAILDLQVRRFTPASRERIHAELAEYGRRLDELDRAGVASAPTRDGIDRLPDCGSAPCPRTSGDVGIFVNGSYGVGKSSVLDHLGDLFARREMPFSLFDVDWFHRSWPRAPHDPRNVLVEAENMRATWENYLSAGPRTPLVAGVIETADDLARYEDVFGRELRVALLTASPRVAEERLRRRYDRDRAEALSWHLSRHRALAAALEGAGCHLVTVNTDDRTPAEVAASVFSALHPTAR